MQNAFDLFDVRFEFFSHKLEIAIYRIIESTIDLVIELTIESTIQFALQ